MGYVKDILKGGASKAFDQIKSYDIGSQLKSSMDVSGINMPKINLDTAAISGKKIDITKIKLPGGAESYISPIAAKLSAGITIPSSINGVPLPKLPELPDLSSVSSQVDGYLSTHGFDTEKLGINSVEDILEVPDLASLKSVSFEVPTTFEIPDLESSIDKFDIAGTLDKVDTLSSLSDSQLENLDISKYF